MPNNQSTSSTYIHWHATTPPYVLINVQSHITSISKYFSKILMSDRTDKRVVTEEQARELANELSIDLFMETSAKVNEGVRRRFSH